MTDPTIEKLAGPSRLIPAMWALTVWHGDELAGADFKALGAMRRMMLALLGNGFITEFETLSWSSETTWSYHRGIANPGEIMDDLVDLIQTLQPDWPFRVRVWIAGGDD